MIALAAVMVFGSACGGDKDTPSGQTPSQVNPTPGSSTPTTPTTPAEPPKPSELEVAKTKLCRPWVITKTRVSIAGSVKANADFTGCDLGEISDFARNQGMEIKRDLSGIKVESVTIASSGEATVKYSSGQPDIADCDFSSLDKGILKYAWREATALGYEIANGTSKVEFESGHCVLTLQSSFEKDSKKYDVSVIFVMTEKK